MRVRRGPTHRHHRPDRAQAAVEAALVLPVVVVLLLVVLQGGLLARDQVTAVHAARASARALAVRPDPAEAQRVLAELGLAGRGSASVTGDRTAGGLVTVTVVLRPTRVPVVGAAVSGVRLRESMTARVEGP